ncbi:hypothetical protein ABEO87_10945 [Geobacillus stearothermophilus]|uniref:hypothetical protein n=1 Tax=Geobacillus stearothermophilus TaxID=1422 RepID=UPI003D216247
MKKLDFDVSLGEWENEYERQLDKGNVNVVGFELVLVQINPNDEKRLAEIARNNPKVLNNRMQFGFCGGYDYVFYYDLEEPKRVQGESELLKCLIEIENEILVRPFFGYNAFIKLVTEVIDPFHPMGQHVHDVTVRVLRRGIEETILKTLRLFPFGNEAEGGIHDAEAIKALF